MDWRAVMLIRALVCLMAPIEILYPLSVCYCYGSPPPLCPPEKNTKKMHVFSVPFFRFYVTELNCVQL